MVNGDEMNNIAIEGEVIKSESGGVIEGVIIPPDKDGGSMESFEIEAGLVDFDP